MTTLRGIERTNTEIDDGSHIEDGELFRYVYSDQKPRLKLVASAFIALVFIPLVSLLLVPYREVVLGKVLLVFLAILAVGILIVAVFFFVTFRQNRSYRVVLRNGRFMISSPSIHLSRSLDIGIDEIVRIELITQDESTGCDLYVMYGESEERVELMLMHWEDKVKLAKSIMAVVPSVAVIDTTSFLK